MATIRSAIKTALKALRLEAHGNRIASHYAHAKDKHPYFCDKITNFDSSEKVGLRLDECRSEIRYTALNGTVVPRVLLNCEWLEAIEAYLRGNKAQAVEECYDAIAVLLRTIDVLEGRQKLGKPTENNKENDK